MKRAALLVLLVSCARAAAPASPPAPPVAARPDATVRVKVVGTTGKPLALAHFTVLGADGKPGEAEEIARDGSFVVPLSAFTGALGRIRITGAGHHEETLVVAREDASVGVTAQLAPLTPHGVEPLVLLDEESTTRMKRQPDGTYVAEIATKDGRHHYTLGGLCNEGLSGAPIDGWMRDARGFYEPEIVVTGGKARITYDPRAFSERPASFVFDDRASASAGLTDVALRVSLAKSRGDALLGDLLHGEGGPPADMHVRLEAGQKAESDALWRDLGEEKARAASRPAVKHAAELGAFSGRSMKEPNAEETALARAILGEVAPGDPLWGLFDSVLPVMRAGEATQQWSDAFVAEQPDTNAVGKILVTRLVKSKDVTEQRALVAQLDGPRFAGTREQEQATDYDPDRTLAPGKALAFEVPALTGGTKLTPKSLAGKVTLVDVWGTWCAPCVSEMPKLHELYAKYGGAPRDGRKKRFEILSIALENSAAPVARFRADKAHPMPWLHAIASPDDFLDGLVPRGRKGVPLYVLLDENGKIVTASPQLRIRANLAETLDRILR